MVTIEYDHHAILHTTKCSGRKYPVKAKVQTSYLVITHETDRRMATQLSVLSPAIEKA